MSLSTEIDSKLTQLKIGMCTCWTKTPEASYHDKSCKYRLVCEIENLLRKEREITKVQDVK
jgi:hypothetical protein